ncbi:hypothetical protein GQ457_09G014120 [Hibiscus cannabinus]
MGSVGHGLNSKQFFNGGLYFYQAINPKFNNVGTACDLPLSLKFPRIFALAKKKSGVIADFGVRCGNSWIWNIQLRRILFDWEIPIWNAFHFLLSNFQSSRL